MLKYVGKGDFVFGIPARDLSDDEVKAFGMEALLSTGLYEEVKKPRTKAKASKEDDQEVNDGR